MRFAIHTCLTSCGSAVAGSPSTMFSNGLANTFPFVSQAKQVGGSEGSTMTIGPTTSFELSAETQESSCSAVDSVSVFEVARALLDDCPSPNFSATSTRFLFLVFLSPLNESGVTMLSVVCRAKEYNSEACSKYDGVRLDPISILPRRAGESAVWHGRTLSAPHRLFPTIWLLCLRGVRILMCNILFVLLQFKVSAVYGNSVEDDYHSHHVCYRCDC
jgi:hypothetical protein